MLMVLLRFMFAAVVMLGGSLAAGIALYNGNWGGMFVYLLIACGVYALIAPTGEDMENLNSFLRDGKE